MSLKATAEHLDCPVSLLQRLMRDGHLPAHKDYTNTQSAKGTWVFDVPLARIRRLVRSAQARNDYERAIAFPRVRFTLSDEDCWGQVSASYMTEGATRVNRSALVVDAEYLCPHCHGKELDWNGRNYYCRRCDPTVPIIPDAVAERVESPHGFPYPAAYVAVTPDDGYYAEATALYRVPAAKNWPRGRNDPKVTVTREGVPDRNSGWGGKSDGV